MTAKKILEMKSANTTLALLLLGALFLAGCVSVGDNNSGDLPWTEPAGWENQTLGVPM